MEPTRNTYTYSRSVNDVQLSRHLTALDLSVGPSIEQIRNNDRMYELAFKRLLDPELQMHFTPPPTGAGGIEKFNVIPTDIPPDFGRSIFTVLTFIPEDSIYRKLLACIPLIGIYVTVRNESSLKNKITESKDLPYIAALVAIKNHYKIASIVRKVLTMVLIITQIATASFAVAGVGIIGTGFISYYAYAIYKNRQLLRELNRNPSNLVLPINVR